jgi:molybdate transport system substrate-binding protein
MPASGRTLRIAAAADLRYALDEVIARFRIEHPDLTVTTTYGSSGTIFAQLVNTAPFDVFLSADISYPRQLAAKGLTLADSEFVYAVGRLVVWVPSSSPLDLQRDGMRVVADARAAHVAIANPDHAPYGVAAVAAMRAASVYEAAKPKLVLGENVSQALQFVQSGAADAGIVALSLALAPAVEQQGRYFVVPLETYPRMEQGGTILRWAASPDAARAFRTFVLSPAARSILKRYGFFLPEA